MPKKKPETVSSLLIGGLFDAIKWTIVYYVGSIAALAGIGGVLMLIEKLRKTKK